MKSIFINKMSEIPIYKQIYDQVVPQILSGELKSNSTLPSIRTMAKEIRVSVITIKKTWDELEKNGYINTIPGKGSYVSAHTEKTLEEMKNDLIKSVFKDGIIQCKALNISKTDIIEIIEDLYNLS
ncbi:GntR family transcriptional regulator [Mycoplasmatota bacterium WC30]